MRSTVSAVIPGLAPGRHLAETVRSLERQTYEDTEIIVVDDGRADDRTRQLLMGLVSRPRVRVVSAAPGAPGAARNAGIGASQGASIVCVDVGDRLDPRYFEKARAALALDPHGELTFVTSWSRWQGLEGDSSLGVPRGCDLATLLCRPGSIHPASMFQRSAWEAVGGFDEDLVGLEDYEFWLRVLEHGYRGTIIEEPLLHRLVGVDSRYRRTIEPDRYLPAMRAVLEKHRVTFEDHLATVLCEKDRLLRELDAHYRPLVRRRDDLVAELGALNQKASRLAEFLRQEGRGAIEWGDLRRTSPVSRDWGYGRGKPIDRYYIERFLETNAGDIRGTVLEVQESDFTLRFGGERVRKSDVVDIDPTNPRTTIVADLRHAPHVPSETYDCVVLTQTLHVIDDMRAVLGECVRILKPGGVLLVTLPCVSRVCLEYGRDGDFWRLTEAGARTLFSEFFAPDRLEIRAYGNVLVNTAFLYGLACHELTTEEFETFDPYFPLLISVRAVKPGGDPVGPEPSERRTGLGVGVRRNTPRTTRAAILLYHRVAEATPDVHGLCVRPPEFRAHMEHLRRHYRPMALGELAAAIRQGAIPATAVAVTLDDGYIDGLTTASPILTECGVPATFFVNTERLDEAHEFWWDTLERILVSEDPIPATLEIELGGQPARLRTGTPADRLATHWALHRAIVASSLVERDRIMRRLADWSGLDLPLRPAHRSMTGEEIVRLAARPGHAIGAHGAHHLALPPQPPERQQEEVVVNKSRLERLIGRSVVAFAYPFGAHDETTVSVVRAASFRIAVTCEPTPVQAPADCWRLPRLEVRGGPALEFARWLDRQLG
ncbi:MAG: polysaccharide deacetylase family protein [Candidatus Rokuibacteriota bacterium]